MRLYKWTTPDPNECPWCGEAIQVVEQVTRWQGVTLARVPETGALEVADWGSQDTSDDGDHEFYECTAAAHSFADLDELDAEQQLAAAVRDTLDEITPECHPDPESVEAMRDLYTADAAGFRLDFPGGAAAIARRVRASAASAAAAERHSARWAREYRAREAAKPPEPTLRETAGVN